MGLWDVGVDIQAKTPLSLARSQLFPHHTRERSDRNTHSQTQSEVIFHDKMILMIFSLNILIWDTWKGCCRFHKILIAHRCSTIDSLLVSPLSLLCCITPFLFPHVSVIPSSPGSTLYCLSLFACLTPLLSVLFFSLFSPSLVCLSH